ncbi:MAG: ClbS/DfsB family four-helix bundle protein [Anaerolineae bacterium]|nr:ClbS/DfsB family four-helix bundle protein [Anaerolineae bacterium]
MPIGISKAALLDKLHSAHADLYAAIDGLSEEQLTRPGVVGGWSVKDLIAHFTYWERRAAFLLQSAIDGYQADDDIWKTGSVDAQNERNFNDNRDLPLAAVLDGSQDILETLLSLIERLPEESLADTSQFGWSQDETLGQRIASETYEHIKEEHWPDLQAWLDSLPR